MYGHPQYIARHIVALSAQRSPRGHAAQVAVAACVGELPGSGAPSEILLIPAGAFSARDGRPGSDWPYSEWHLDAAGAARLIAAAEAARGDTVIDYEHQTLLAEDNGQPAPAAGWFRQMEWREGQGLYALNVRWTDRARAMIEAGEYRYISPVFEHDTTTGEVTALLMAALTNYPALDGHSDLAARAAARFHQTHEEDSTVDRTQLIILLGLAAAATDEQITAALTALKKDHEALVALRTELGVDEQGDAKAAVVALKTAKSATPDPSQYVPKGVYDETAAQLVALKATGETAELDRLIAEGLEDGRIPGQATADWLRGQGLAALKAHLADAPSIAALKGTQTQGKKPDGGQGDSALTEAELAVCKNMGMTPEAYKAAKAQ